MRGRGGEAGVGAVTRKAVAATSTMLCTTLGAIPLLSTAMMAFMAACSQINMLLLQDGFPDKLPQRPPAVAGQQTVDAQVQAALGKLVPERKIPVEL